MNVLMLPVAVALFFSCGNNKAAKQTSTVTENTPVAVTSTEGAQDSQIVATPEEITAPAQEIALSTENAVQKELKTSKKEEKNVVLEDDRKEIAMEATIEPIAETVEEEVQELEKEKEAVEEVIIETKEVQATESPKEIKAIDHGPWNSLLKKYVNDQGNVDYKGFAQDADALNAYLTTLAQNVPEESAPKNEKLAYYINLYNAATVKLIIDNYPTTSIKRIKSPWGKKIVPIGNEKVSLGDIEHKILRKMNEPRIHFAINCASFSCPKLVNKAFTAAQMEQQLEAASIDFVNDTTRNIITADKAQLSEIFKWYKKDFTEKGTSLKDYINKYAKTTISPKAKVSYLKYDWSLNEAK
ncbi:DUF547 domain-containing protein [Spongiimicrobium salis]|uniref:DUF547 domain-containing protein n=1 Tax=Spongiimicrobium salis TaxID=1667022 RepID=UPI00374D695C